MMCTFGARGSLLFSSVTSLLAAAVLALAAAGFFLATVVDFTGALPPSSSLPLATSGFTTVAPLPAGFFVIVAEFTDDAVVFDIVLELATVVAAMLERASPRALSRTAFSAYSLIWTKHGL
jgi:hypothetical protein